VPQHVVVVRYDPRWPRLYEREAAQIRRILGPLLVSIHHIGSTAVPGLAAKPIIDILPVVTDVEAVDALKPAFEAIGYEYLGEFGIPGRRYLRKGGDERTHQLHIFGRDHEADIRRHLAVRDYLRTHPETALAYGNLKRTLAKRYPFDIDGYCDGKDAFVKALEQAALEWYGETGR
jgi:GrpB-like predicted nucleotidyltransferase (UPF0157 family)